MKEYRAMDATLPDRSGNGARAHHAADRIVRAAAATLPRRGAAALSMQEVAAAAGVSKALIHYHFRDKNALLRYVVDHLDTQMTERGQRALADASPSTAVDELARWVSTEIDRGEWRATLELKAWPHADVRDAVERSLRSRRATAQRLITRFYALLGLRPRVAPAVGGELLLALVSGLAVLRNWGAGADNESRAAFDAFALALLGLAT